MKFDFRQLTSRFQLYGNFVVAVPYGTGHINDTFQVTFDQGGTLLHYIIQRVNTNVFKAPEELMDNFLRVTRHIGAKIRDERAADPATRRRTLEVVNSIYGKPYWRDPAGNFFRCYVFVENARSYDILETKAQAYQAAAAFGNFQADLADLPQRLNETIRLPQHPVPPRESGKSGERG